MRQSDLTAVPLPETSAGKLAGGKLLGLSALAVLGTLTVLALDFWLTPALINLLEALTGKYAPIEIVVRIHFLVVFSQLILVYCALLFIYPVKTFQKRMLLYFLLAEALVLCAIWLFDQPNHYFWSEESALTFSTAVVCILCSVAALMNAFYLHVLGPQSRMAKLFWLLLITAFLYAGLDEFFMIHEKLRALLFTHIGWAGDAETGSYGIGGLIFVAIFYKTLKNDLLRTDRSLFKLLLAGSCCFVLSSVFDSFDWVVANLVNPYMLYYSPLNSVEEALEFTAGTLFLCGFVLNLFEINDHRLLDLATAREHLRKPGKPLKYAFWGFAAAMMTVYMGIGAADQLKSKPILTEKGYRVSTFADIADGLDRPDGLLYSPNPGLLLANGNEASNILVFDRQGHGRQFTGPGTGLISPEGMAIRNHSLFVADDSGKDVLQYDHSGKVVATITNKAFKSPDGVAVDSRGQLYIADQKLALIFRIVGDRREVLASSLDGLEKPNDMVFDDQGNLYVTDEEARAVFKISPAGEVTTLADLAPDKAVPHGITFHNGRIYVTDERKGTIYRFKPDGSGGRFLTFGKKYRGLMGITFDDRGDLFVVSTDPNSIQGYIFRIEAEGQSPGF